jgi:HAD superfamily hydrolase (TIGR01509 family)
MPRSGYPPVAPALGAVTFDMDGLLVDSEPLWFQAESAVMERLQGTWAHGDQDALVGGSMAATVAYLLSKGTRPAEPAVVARWLREAMLELLRTARLPVLPGAVELVAEVQSAGLPYALVTSSEPEVVDAVLAKLSVAFPVIVCGADVSHAKPDPEGYLLAAAKLGVEPWHTIALEDSVNGVLAAEAAGYRTVAVPSVVPVQQRPGRIVLPTLAGVTLAHLATRAGLAL